MKKYSATEVYKHLTVGTRSGSGETYFYFKDDTPQAMSERWQELTSAYDDYNFADLDEYYSVLYGLVSTIHDARDDFSEDDLYNIDWRDDYNADRLDWLKANLSRAQFYDDIKGNGAEGIFELIGDMQDLSRGQFANYVYANFLDTEEE
jgi:hypothetical protein